MEELNRDGAAEMARALSAALAASGLSVSDTDADSVSVSDADARITICSLTGGSWTLCVQSGEWVIRRRAGSEHPTHPLKTGVLAGDPPIALALVVAEVVATALISMIDEQGPSASTYELLWIEMSELRELIIEIATTPPDLANVGRAASDANFRLTSLVWKMEERARDLETLRLIWIVIAHWIGITGGWELGKVMKTSSRCDLCGSFPLDVAESLNIPHALSHSLTERLTELADSRGLAAILRNFHVAAPDARSVVAAWYDSDLDEHIDRLLDELRTTGHGTDET